MNQAEPTAAGLRYRMRRAARQIAAQHRDIGVLHVALRAELRRGAVKAARSNYIRYRDAVDAHFSLEENVFFPALHGLHPEQRRALEGFSKEHQTFLGALVRIGETLEAETLEAESLKGVDRALGEYLESFGDHEQREERLVAKLAQG